MSKKSITVYINVKIKEKAIGLNSEKKKKKWRDESSNSWWSYDEVDEVDVRFTENVK